MSTVNFWNGGSEDIVRLLFQLRPDHFWLVQLEFERCHRRSGRMTRSYKAASSTA
jgi:hypothetical protein